MSTAAAPDLPSSAGQQIGPDPGTGSPGGAPGTGSPGGPASAAGLGLPQREHDVLAFERQWWRYAGAKEAAIRERFGLSATRYYQVLNAVIDRPEALAADPLLVRRLRRVRAARQRQRAGRTLASGR